MLIYTSYKTALNPCKELQLSEREWGCRECGTLHNRDLNAAINLKNYKPKDTANAAEINACGDQVRPVKKYKLSSGQGRGSKNQDFNRS